MSEPERDYRLLNAGLQQVHRRGVSKHMRGDTLTLQRCAFRASRGEDTIRKIVHAKRTDTRAINKLLVKLRMLMLHGGHSRSIQSALILLIY
jgi:hypothetical protein